VVISTSLHSNQADADLVLTLRDPAAFVDPACLLINPAPQSLYLAFRRPYQALSAELAMAVPHSGEGLQAGTEVRPR
jgi:hypothetical protein